METSLYILDMILNEKPVENESEYYEVKTKECAFNIANYVTWFLVNMMMLYVYSTFGTKEYEYT